MIEVTMLSMNRIGGDVLRNLLWVEESSIDSIYGDGWEIYAMGTLGDEYTITFRAVSVMWNDQKNAWESDDINRLSDIYIHNGVIPRAKDVQFEHFESSGYDRITLSDTIIFEKMWPRFKKLLRRKSAMLVQSVVKP